MWMKNICKWLFPELMESKECAKRVDLLNDNWKLQLKKCNETHEESLEDMESQLDELKDENLELSDLVDDLEYDADILLNKLAEVPEKEFIPEQVIAWEDKYPAMDIYYLRPIYNKRVKYKEDIRHFINPRDPRIKAWVENRRLQVYHPWKCNDKIAEIYKTDRKNYEYAYDSTEYGTEMWLYPAELIKLGKGDCLSIHEEIYTKEGIKKMGEITEGDEVLSHDFNTGFVYKPVTRVWEKGKLPVKRVHWRNGTYTDMSEKHNLLIRCHANKKGKYEKTMLKDIDMTRWWKKKTPIVKKLPYKIRDIPWLNKDLCFVIGHYVAEGFKDKHHIRTSGFDCPLIAEKLDKNNIPFSEYKNNSGVPIITFLDSPFKQYLKTIKENSFCINLPEEIFHLPKQKIQSLLDGYFLGDGHNRGGYNGCPITRDYSTVSKQLASDLQRLHLQLGKPLYCWKQENHKGKGQSPIYRLRLNPNSYFNQFYGHDGLSEVSISFIEDLPPIEMRDITVKDTKNFVLKNGVVSHNCEDYTNLLASRLIAAGVPSERIRCVAGYTNKSHGGHATVYVLGDDFETWYHLNSTGTKTYDKLEEYPTSKSSEDDMGVIGENIWFAWNDKKAWHKFRTDLAVKTYKNYRFFEDVVIE